MFYIVIKAPRVLDLSQLIFGGGAEFAGLEEIGKSRTAVMGRWSEVLRGENSWVKHLWVSREASRSPMM